MSGIDLSGWLTQRWKDSFVETALGWLYVSEVSVDKKELVVCAHMWKDNKWIPSTLSNKQLAAMQCRPTTFQGYMQLSGNPIWVTTSHVKQWSRGLTSYRLEAVVLSEAKLICLRDYWANPDLAYHLNNYLADDYFDPSVRRLRPDLLEVRSPTVTLVYHEWKLVCRLYKNSVEFNTQDRILRNEITKLATRPNLAKPVTIRKAKPSVTRKRSKRRA